MNQFEIYFTLFNIIFHVLELQILVTIRSIVALEFPEVDFKFQSVLETTG